MESGSALQHVGSLHQTVPVAIPPDYFYIDPSCGRRIPNIVTEVKHYECFRLNTPAPVMSTRPAPPNRPDPFSAGPYPTRDLGSPTMNMHPGLPPVTLPWQTGPKRTVLQLTLEEDLAINSLLKLYREDDARHGQPLHGVGNGTHANITDPQTEHFGVGGGGSSLEIKEPVPADGPYPQAVRLSLSKEGETWKQKDNYWGPELEEGNPDHSFLIQEGSELCTRSPSTSKCNDDGEDSPSLADSQGNHADDRTQTWPVSGEMNALGAVYSRLDEGRWVQNDDDVLTLPCNEEEPLTESPPAAAWPMSPRSGLNEGSRQGVFWELQRGRSERTMLESECEAVTVLLGLGEQGTL